LGPFIGSFEWNESWLSFQFYDWKIPFFLGIMISQSNCQETYIQVGTHFIILSSPVIPSTQKLAAFGHGSLSQVFVSLTLWLLWQRVNQHSLTHSQMHHPWDAPCDLVVDGFNIFMGDLCVLCNFVSFDSVGHWSRNAWHHK